MTTKSALDLYLKSQTAVKGWLDPYSAEVIAELGEFPAADGVARYRRGDRRSPRAVIHFAELLRRSGEQSVVINVFEDEHLNIDLSGRGDRGKFSGNVERWSGDENLIVIQKSSLDVTPEELLDKAGEFQLFFSRWRSYGGMRLQ